MNSRTPARRAEPTQAGAIDAVLRVIARRIGGDGPDDPLADFASGAIDADEARRRGVNLV